MSDVYVRLGYEFNMACRAFSAINVDTSDLGNVPELLRNILEATLSQEASVESLEKYLPRIRDIIINLLHGLKRKQQRLRQKQVRDKEGGAAGDEGGVARTMSTSTMASTGTMASTNSGLTTLLNEGIENGYNSEVQVQREESLKAGSSSPSRRFVSKRDESHGSGNSDLSTLSSATMQNMPVLPPYPGDETIPRGPSQGSDLDSIDSFPAAPAAAVAAEGFAAERTGSPPERRRPGEEGLAKVFGLPNIQASGLWREWGPDAALADGFHTQPWPGRGKGIAAGRAEERECQAQPEHVEQFEGWRVRLLLACQSTRPGLGRNRTCQPSNQRQRQPLGADSG